MLIVEPASISVTNQPADAKAGEVLEAEDGYITVKVEAEDGSPVAGIPVTVSLLHEKDIDFAEASATTLETGEDGTVMFVDLMIEKAQEDFKLLFEVEGVDTARSTAFDVAPGALSGARSTWQEEAGQDKVVVQAYDRYGNGIESLGTAFEYWLVELDSGDDLMWAVARTGNVYEITVEDIDGPGDVMAVKYDGPGYDELEITPNDTSD